MKAPPSEGLRFTREAWGGMNGSGCASQSGVFAFLSDPATHGLSEAVTRIDTHGAAVFLAGENVYKVKRAVRYPFMDFSTLEKRRAACEREIAVNKPNAPGLYLGAVPITCKDGRFHLGGSGETVEWALHMRRFDENRTLDRLAERNELSLEIAGRLASAIAGSHRRAPVITGLNARQALEGLLSETLEAFAAAPGVFAPSTALLLRQAMEQALAQGGPLLSKREQQGQVRRCHGDLHLRNIALIGGEPVLFDAIEFDDSIATCDVLYDLAFLLMDLWTRGLPRHANAVLNRYLWICDDIEAQLKGLALMPLYLSLRAAIRAKVAILQPGSSKEREPEARRYFAAALALLSPARLDLVAIGGLSGSGKSSLAAELAPSVGRAPGAVHLRSDIERKRLCGAQESERLPGSAYTPEMNAKTYEWLRSLASTALDAGQSAVVDAVHLRHAERLAVQQTASRCKAHFTGLWLDAPLQTLTQRVAAREGDASDATVEVLSEQAKLEPGMVGWLRLDASAPLEDLARQARERVLA
jgi:hypothetical protein